MKPTLNKSLVTLMIVSQVLLIAFVIQWLSSQYKSEKAELEKEMTWQFEKSQQEVFDSLLEINLITPMLKRKSGFKISMHDENTDTSHSTGKVKMYVNRNVSHDSIEEMVTIVTDSLGKTETVNIHGEPNDDILTRGVRLIMKETTTNPRHQQEFERRIFSGDDSVMLKTVLEKRFKGNGWAFSARFIDGKSDSISIHQGKGIYLESSMFPEKYGLEVEDFRFYLLNKILPQSLFAIILLLLTGFAFLISYRTLRNQLRLNAMKNEFIDNISHELKTPLSTVKVVVEALRDENIRKDDKTTREYLEMASMEINRLELLTGKVLSTSMIEGGIVKMEKQKIDLSKLINDLIYTLKVRLTNENSSLNFEQDEENYFIDGDILHVQGALLNVIDNSLKYSGRNSKIEITLEKNDRQVTLRVKDNGPGIPLEYLKKIFDKFFRVPSGNLHNVKGHGLGLSYVFMVMKMHGGNINAENNPQGGSIFTLTFPKSA
jgi:signal transduction histidine kinase